MKKNFLRSAIAVIASGFAMWVMAGLWHNLVLPAFNSDVKAHHEGIFIMLIAYFILAGFMTYIYSEIKKKNKISSGLKTGILIGILWVLPHGLAMAGAHQTSILYEFQNAFWHLFEQAIGGLVIGMIKGYEPFY